LVGEPSGDIHAAELIKELLAINNEIEIVAWGGKKMQTAGAKIIVPLEKLSFMGFWEVIKNIFSIFFLFKKAKKDILDFNPDVLILVDYPGFNLRIAKWAKKKNITTCYYISPQLWAWNTKRVKIIQSCIKKVFVIFPFEKEFYKQYGVDATYIGNPIVSKIDEFINCQLKIEKEKINILLLPGSRTQEVSRNLPIMLQLCNLFPAQNFVISGLSIIPKSLYNENGLPPNVSIQYENTYQLLNDAKIAIVTSGTATLETALFGVPQIVVYRSDWFSYYIAKMLIKVPYISIVNLIAGEEIVKELIQNNFNPLNLEIELKKLLISADRKYFNHYKNQLIEPNGVKNAARTIISIIP
jgi:lipid-A-disaccharide synthase